MIEVRTKPSRGTRCHALGHEHQLEFDAGRWSVEAGGEETRTYASTLCRAEADWRQSTQAVLRLATDPSRPDRRWQVYKAAARTLIVMVLYES